MLKRAVSLLSGVTLLLVLAASAQASDPQHSVAPQRTAGSGPNTYRVTRLVSDQPGEAAHLDPNLVNAWGLVAGPSTPWWVADADADVSTLYDGTGSAIPLVVSVAGGPTGTVFNGGADFVVHHKGDAGPSVFMFATESGTIRGWNPAVPAPGVSTRSFIVVNRSAMAASYKGLAIASAASRDFIYATDFHNGRVDVFDGDFDRVVRPGAFVDPELPASFAPFGIQEIDDHIFVTYAKQDADAEDDVTGAGLGFVDMYSKHGDLLGRVASRGALNAPWGLTFAPSDFGHFSGDLLVGNFGNGKINAYRPKADGSFAREGVLRRVSGSILSIDGLWALQFGNGGPAGPTNSLFFTAGPDDESHGLFGKIEARS
jgi:uncharacterized protein (TIGR03118 family)